MIFTLNYLACQKDVPKGKEEEEAGDRREGDQTGTPTPGADAPTGPTRSYIRGGCWTECRQTKCRRTKCRQT